MPVQREVSTLLLRPYRRVPQTAPLRNKDSSVTTVTNEDLRGIMGNVGFLQAESKDLLRGKLVG
jgi:hypothetical protein